MVRDFVVGEWTVFPDRNTMEAAGDVVHLEPRVMDLLVYLAERPNEVLSLDQIIADVWPHTFVTNGVLLTAISSLRKSLRDNRRRPIYIETIPKRGYRFIAASSARTVVLAVLPIRNESGDPDRSFLAEGITASLTDSLGTIPALRVISRSSAMSVGESGKDVASVASKLGASLVLSGSVKIDRHADLVVAFRLMDLTDGRTLLDQTRSRPEHELLELEQDVVEAVADAIGDRLRSRPPPRSGKANPDAVIEYMRGRYHYYRQSPDHFARALEHFERSIRADPAYAPAHVGVSDVWGAYGYWGARDARDVRDRVLTHARQAIEIDPDNPDALVLQAANQMYLEHDWQAAESNLRRAIGLNPNLCHTRIINALFLGTLRRPQALDEITRALRIDPLNPAVILVRALIRSSLGDHAGALEDTDEILDIDPRHPPGLQLRAELHWQSASRDAIDFEREAWHSDEEMLAVLAVDPDPGSDTDPDPSTALERAAGVLIARSATAYVAPYEIARLLSLAGQVEKALDRIEDALYVGDLMRVDFLQLSPAFASVRAHARYRDIAERLGIPA